MHDMTATELDELMAKLKDTIRKNPNHSRVEQIELEDAEQWLRAKKQQQRNADEGEIVV